jgi:hypothetical protein
MRKTVVIISMIIWVLLGLPHGVSAFTDSTALIENGKQLDGKKIVYAGEVIREPMLRGNYGWINVSDGSNTIGVWTEKKAILRIKRYGCYQNSGDRVKIMGIFHRSCPVHGGDMDIHAQTLEIIQPGAVKSHPVKANQYFGAFLALSVALLTCLLRWNHME